MSNSRLNADGIEGGNVSEEKKPKFELKRRFLKEIITSALINTKVEMFAMHLERMTALRSNYYLCYK